MAVVKAIHKFARISPTKVRPFADLIRGKTTEQAIDALKYMPNRGARMIEKVLASAIANAEDRGARNVMNLKVALARVDGGPSIKRFRPRARGMAAPIIKRMAHIHVGVEAPEL
ncbi:MAG: 50S ribosomal protein L22 [Planctomycetaceae bacterium]|jgi:large subunit ribosomal protein L22|nr:50S ribosomal protein L22 [Planctomycetaceae bacterium]MDC0274221.1 50S ribosomal protein L22 [Planctomycetaceae bacterium]MDG2390602.1 50S ribosomal protein L22 [Planctomycetaceae bacterium]